MKKLLFVFAAVAMLLSCRPDEYITPVDENLRGPQAGMAFRHTTIMHPTSTIDSIVNTIVFVSSDTVKNVFYNYPKHGGTIDSSYYPYLCKYSATDRKISITPFNTNAYLEIWQFSVDSLDDFKENRIYYRVR